MKELREQYPHVPVVLVGTQEDLRDDSDTQQQMQKRGQKCVTPEQGHKLARKLGAQCYLECSALTKKGLKSVF